MKTYFRLLSFAKPIEKFAIPYVIFTILTVIFSTLNLALLAPLLNTIFFGKDIPDVITKPHGFDLKHYFDYYSYLSQVNYGKTGVLHFVCMVIVVSVLLGNLFRYLSQRVMENLRIHTLLNIRRTVFNNVMNLHMGYFSNERKGDILAKVSSDVQVVQYSVTGTLQVIFKEPLTLLTYLVWLFAISYKLTFFAMMVIPISGFIISKIVKKLKHQAFEAQASYGQMINNLDESLTGIKIIKGFNAVEFIKNRFNKENVYYSRIVKAMAKRQQLASPVSEFLGTAMVASIVWYGGGLVIQHKGDLSAPEFITYIAMFSQIMRPAKAMSDAFSNIHSGIAAGERVLTLIDVKPEIVDAPDAMPIEEFEHEIKFENVSFAYNEKMVLNNINITIPKGKKVALVGPSGGGKSTTMDLLPRFIEPQTGSILIDGHNINALTTESVRALMGIVGQESMLFNDTIYNNIAFGRPDATMEEVEAAARIANAHEFILASEKGYQTNTGDRGSKLSGGQKQRICIARAVLNNPPIMLLDEATSALDTESEKLVQEALNNLMQNRTSLIIAHRLSTIQNADIIYVLDDGKVVEQGSHNELLANNGVYKKLIDMQSFGND